MNKNRKIRHILPKAGMTALMAATALAGMGTPVFAAAGTNYGTTIEGTKTTTFDKFLVMDSQANVPNATFSYAVTAGNAKAYSVADKNSRFSLVLMQTKSQWQALVKAQKQIKSCSSRAMVPIHTIQQKISM